MTWHGQINRTIWEIETALQKQPADFKLRRELLRTHFLQRYEFDRSLHIPRDDRSFLFLQDDRAPAILLLHGASGTPAEMRDLGNYLYGRGFTVYCPRVSRYDLKKRTVSWESWVTSAGHALETLLKYSSQTAVVGLGMGATVALVLQQLHPVAGVVALAPAIYPRYGFKDGMQAILRRLAPAVFYRFAGWHGEVLKAMEHVRGQNVTIKAPLLALQAKDDRAVSTRGLKLLKKKLSADGGDVVLLPAGSHALTRGSAREDVFERVLVFARGLQPPKGDGRPRRESGPRRSGDGRSRRSREGAPRRSAEERPRVTDAAGDEAAGDGQNTRRGRGRRRGGRRRRGGEGVWTGQHGDRRQSERAPGPLTRSGENSGQSRGEQKPGTGEGDGSRRDVPRPDADDHSSM